MIPKSRNYLPTFIKIVMMFALTLILFQSSTPTSIVHASPLQRILSSDKSEEYLNSDTYTWSIYNFIDYKQSEWTTDNIDFNKLIASDLTKMETMNFQTAQTEFGYTNETKWDKDKSCFSFIKDVWKMFPSVLKDNQKYTAHIGGISPLNLISF